MSESYLAIMFFGLALLIMLFESIFTRREKEGV
jgi:hypothetical protein